MDDDEREHHRVILDARPGWAVEAAYAYARWLEERGRLSDAAHVLEPALREGPDWGIRGELACVTLLDDLRAAWARVQEKLDEPRPRVIETAHDGSFVADWPAVLATIA